MKDAESIKYGLVCCSSDYGVSDICGRMGCPYKTGYADCVHKLAGDALELIKKLEAQDAWIPATEMLPECEVGAEIGNVEWISHDMVFAGCFGRGGKYRDAYFRTWTDTTEGIDAKDADCWRVVTLPEPPKEEDHAKDGPDKAD